MKNNMKKLSFLLFGLVLLLAACGSGNDSKGNEKNNASESGSEAEKTYKIGISLVALAAACAEGVEFAKIKSTPDTITNTVAFLKELGAKKVGMVYNAGEQNSVAQVTETEKLMAEQGLSVVKASAASSTDVKSASESLIGKIDAFYIITDNTVVNALESVIDVANTNELPLIVGELDSVERGGLAAYGFSYYDIGYEAGQMAVKILKGDATPAELPAQYPQSLKLVIIKESFIQLFEGTLKRVS